MIFEPLLAPLAFVLMIVALVGYGLYRRARDKASRATRDDADDGRP
jgi:hypothetical protein